MFVLKLFSWICCITFVAGQFVFQPENATFRNLVVDSNTGHIFIGGVNYLYKLSKNLTELNKIYTPSLVSNSKSNINQLLMIENLTGTPRLFACGTYSFGLCLAYDVQSFSHTVHGGTLSAVSKNEDIRSIALEDPYNNGIVIAGTRDHTNEASRDYTFNTYGSTSCSGQVKQCIGKRSSLDLTKTRPMMHYILATIVGDFRYFFSHSDQDGTIVARLCKNYPHVVEIKTYMEMRLQCVGKDDTNYDQLVAGKVVRPSGKLAEKFGSTGDDDDAVLIGVFQKLSEPSQSAVCSYTFKEINDTFWKNINKCFSSNTVILNEYITDRFGNAKKCSKESPKLPCSQNSKNEKMIGTIKHESEALVTCGNCGLITSMDTTTYQGNIIAFLGSSEGKLSKFIMYSNSFGRRYETSHRISGSGILSVRFDLSGTSAYLLSEYKVKKIPVEECSNRTTCERCVEGADPYCGWCTLKAICTTYDNCPYYGSPLGYVRYSNECISISVLNPSSLPLSKTAIQKINISIVNLPVGQKTNAYGCSVNNVKMPSSLNGNTLECSVPTSAQLPEASSETGLVNAEVAVLSNETGAKITTSVLEFYKCSAILSCLKCTTGSLKCSWCHYEAKCVADGSSICPKSFAPWTIQESQHQCPMLSAQTLYIPASVKRVVTLRGTRLPQPETPHGQYSCIVNDGDQNYSVPATWNNSTSISCGAQQYKYAGSSLQISANISVKLGKSDVKPEHGQVQVYLYQCKKAAALCGSCVGFSKAEYKCGWCENTTSCSVSDGCPAEPWIEPGGECPGSPKINSFYPKTGHIKGNLRLEIEGKEFGRKYEDVDEVSIGGLGCKTIKKDYIIAERIVCLTNYSSKSLSARIKVVISGKVGYSKEKFHYQNPQVDNYEPKIGPVSGGTKLTICGKDLDTGNDIQVFLGGSKCLNLSIGKTILTCTTSPFKNVTRKRRSISNENLVVSFNGLPPVYGQNITSFQYVPDPVITGITPRITFPSSHRQINVTGTNLNGIHFPRVRLTFRDTKDHVEKLCGKPSFHNMLCSLPDLRRNLTDDVDADISLYLDAVTTWVDLSSYPQFNFITIVPDPVIYKFPGGSHVLKSPTLKIEGKYLEVDNNKDLLKFVITVGGKRCNITGGSEVGIFCAAPDRKSLPKLESYQVVVNVSGSDLSFNVGNLKYDITDGSGDGSIDMGLIFIIIGVCVGVILIFVIWMCCLYRRKKRQQEQKEKTYEMQMNSLESKVAKECREAFAELQTDMSDFTTDLGDGSIHFFDFKNYAMHVLFPGVDSHDVMKERKIQESPPWDEALRTFSQLIGNKNFLLIFVKTIESQNHFKMQDRCNVASLLVIALQNKMDYCTDILQHLLAELIRKSMSKSHPKLLFRRTECIAEKLLTNWLTFTLSSFMKDKAGKSLFMLYKAIRFQVEKGPIDAITNEARYSLSEDKLLRQSIEYSKLTVTVEFEDNPPVQVDVLDTDTIEQAKEKIMDVVFKNVPYSSRVAKDELTLKWVVSPSNHTILKDEDVSSAREGEWKRLNTLGHYQVPDGTCLRLVKRFASAFDTSEIHNASLPKVSYSPSLYSTASLVQSSKQNISDADRKPWHLTKHVDSYAQEKDDPRHSKMLSEIYLTRLLSTKGTLQQFVDDMFDCIFPKFRKNERPPLPVKLLFDFLDDQAKELNITDPEVLHTWKNNSLPLRFWVNIIKNPNFLFDVYKAPIVDSCLSVIAQLFMDACSVSDHILGKDSPSNKLLYAKEIPVYKQKVESFYDDVANAPKLTDEEIKDFFSSHYTDDFNVDVALQQLYKYASTYQDELQEALEDARYPQLASKLEHVVAIFSDD